MIKHTLMICCLLVLALAVLSTCFAEGDPTAAPSPDTNIQKSHDIKHDPAYRREEARAWFLASIFIVGGFFLFVLIITLVRMNRNQCRLNKIGQKEKPTDYVDAWSKHTLKNQPKQ